ncbi:MAG TPA: hypothetical protein VEL77_11490, partial [Rugosimonospora sp.]|nr:hypothetical protein [Rugosimonospora sp.]
DEVEAVAVRVFAGPSFAFDVEGLELAGHVFSIAEIRPPNPPSKATVCAMTKGNIAELAAIVIALLVVFAVNSNNRIQRRTV